MIFKYMKKDEALMAADQASGEDIKPTQNSEQTNNPAVVEYRAAAIEARAADARFAAAEARVASTIASADAEYKASSAAAASAARSAVAFAKTNGEDINQYEGSRETAEAEYKAAMNARSSAEARVAAAEEALKEDVELAALAYVLAKKDTIEKDIAMALLEESEIKIISQKYNVDESYTRVKYKKEKMAVQLAEEEANEIAEDKETAQTEAVEAKKKAEKLANYIAEYDEFNDVGLADKRYKQLASDAKSEMKDATVKSLQAEKELEDLIVKLAEEQEEVNEIKERSEIYREVQDRITEPLNKAVLAKNKGKTLPHDYQEDLSSVAKTASVKAAIAAQKKAQELVSIARMRNAKRWGVMKILLGLSLSGSATYFALINPMDYLQFAIPCFIAGMSMIGFGVKEYEDNRDIPTTDGSVGIDEIDIINQSLTRSLSKSLIKSLNQPQSK